ncbi:hypothetical protein Ancab_017452, partial [Ancistrocladus abbreviatus]
MATKVSGCIDDPNRIVASPERLFTEQMVNVTNEQCKILNMNRLHCNTSPSGQLEPNLTPCQIWDFIEQIGVQDKTNLEDVVRRIGDMEQCNWEAFQQLASAGKQNDVGRE